MDDINNDWCLAIVIRTVIIQKSWRNADNVMVITTAGHKTLYPIAYIWWKFPGCNVIPPRDTV